MGETSRIEYKRELNEEVKLEKEVIAFLNYKDGGVIFFGIDKDGNNIGISDLDGDMLKIKNRIKDNILPSAMGLFDVIEEQRDGVNIIKVIVASGSEKPYYNKQYGMTPKGCYIRIGTSAEQMPQSMIEHLFSKRTRNSIGKIRSYRQDLTFEQLRIYYEERQKTLNGNFARTLELKTSEDEYNYVAYLLSDENNISIKVASYSSLDRTELKSNKEYGLCSLVKAAKSVYDKLKDENNRSSEITTNDRIDTLLWDEIALREVIRNAIVHNDYSTEIPPKFEIFPDRLEITSSGTLPNSMSKSEFYEGLSVPRNKELMRVFSDLGLVESLGSGIPRIVKAYGKRCFQFMDNFTRVVFPNKTDSNQDSNQDGNQDSNQEQSLYSTLTKAIFDYATEQKSIKLQSISDKNRLLFNELKEVLSGESLKIIDMCTQSSLSKSEIFNLLEMSNQTKNTNRHITPLLENNLITQTIKDKPQSRHQKYRTTKLGVMFLFYIEYLIVDK